VPERSFVVGSAGLPRPTRGAGSLLALAVGLELVGRVLGSRGLTLVAAGFIGTLIAAAVLTPRISGTRLTFDGAARLTAGASSAIGLVATAPDGWRGIGPILVTDTTPAYADTAVMISTLRPGESAVATFPVRPPQRGHWLASTVTVEALSPLGGFARRRTVSLPGALWVHPSAARPLPLPSLGSLAARHGSRTRRSPVGTEIAGLREWRTGDPAGRVNWRASARRNQIVVMEREDNQRVAVLIAIGVAGDDDAWERAVARSAATAVDALRSGHSLDLLRADGPVTARTARDVLDFFAELVDPAPASTETIAASLRRAGPGAVLVWLSAQPPPADVAAVVRSASAGFVSALSAATPEQLP
jgi:uncharacterized protein (DUF58 family)